MIAGLAYESICLPWDVARRTVQLDRITHAPSQQSPVISLILQKAREDGVLSFLQAHDHRSHHVSDVHSGIRRKIYGILRTVGRVGPWGIGFLVWETYGYGGS